MAFNETEYTFLNFIIKEASGKKKKKKKPQEFI